MSLKKADFGHPLRCRLEDTASSFLSSPCSGAKKDSHIMDVSGQNARRKDGGATSGRDPENQANETRKSQKIHVFSLHGTEHRTHIVVLANEHSCSQF